MFPSPSSPWVMNNVSQLDLLIAQACNPSQREPNFARHFEIAEYINQKKSNTPREAAMTIAKLVNSRNPHAAMLALALLETLVQSCGYPFHLQIATKEFLNELVRRFPERPPPFPGPVMQKIIDLIHSWKEGICIDSRWKDDFGNIRDMHRLLTFKGYRFREMLRPVASNLKSADELEAEDREAQSAKLQELIRRGTPRDLAAAQELMKTLAGANPDAKPDYRTQSLTELNKLESKVILLNEILDNVDTSRGERFVQGDVYNQVASILRDARPKIQTWISNAETDDPESLDTYLQINDQINTVLNRYESYKNGDYTAAANPIPPELSNGAGPSGSQSVSLIDFDDTPQPSVPSNSGAGAGGIDELASLFGPTQSMPLAPAATPVKTGSNMGTGYGLGAHINTGTGVNSGTGMGGNQQTPPIYQAPTPIGFNGTTSPSTLNSQPSRTGMVSPSGGAALGSIRLGTPQLQPQPPSQTSQMQYGQPAFFPQQQQPMQPQTSHPQQSTPANGQPQAQGKDPFADLVGLF